MKQSNKKSRAQILREFIRKEVKAAVKEEFTEIQLLLEQMTTAKPPVTQQQAIINSIPQPSKSNDPISSLLQETAQGMSSQDFKTLINANSNSVAPVNMNMSSYTPPAPPVELNSMPSHQNPSEQPQPQAQAQPVTGPNGEMLHAAAPSTKINLVATNRASSPDKVGEIVEVPDYRAMMGKLKEQGKL